MINTVQQIIVIAREYEVPVWFLRVLNDLFPECRINILSDEVGEEGRSAWHPNSES